MTTKKRPLSTHAGHRGRMRQRFLSDRDLSGFSEHELLEMVLYFCYTRADTNELAHKLLDRFGSLDAVMSSTPEELASTGIIGKRPAETVTILYSLAAYLRRGGGAEPVDARDHIAVGKYIQSFFIGEEREKLLIFPLSSDLTIRNCILLGEGGRQNIRFNASEIAKKMLPLKQRSLIIAHNHPFSTSSPSANDVHSTNTLVSGLRAYGMTLEDHYIIGTDGFTSLRQTGALYEH